MSGWTRIVSGTLGTVGSGGTRLLYRSETWELPGVESITFIDLEPQDRGTLDVQVHRRGDDMAGAWGVNPEPPSRSPGVISPAAARKTAHVLLAAAALADQLNDWDQLSPTGRAL